MTPEGSVWVVQVVRQLVDDLYSHGIWTIVDFHQVDGPWEPMGNWKDLGATMDGSDVTIPNLRTMVLVYLLHNWVIYGVNVSKIYHTWIIWEHTLTIYSP